MAKEKVTQTTKAAAKPAPKAKVTARHETKEVAVRAPAGVPAGLSSRIAADSGAGMEGTDKDSFAIPRIVVLQSLSPQCTRGKPEFNPDLKPGMFFNTVTGEAIPGDVGITIVPCAFQRRFIQWGPRGTERAGFKGEWMPEDVAAARVEGKISELENQLFLGEPNPKKSDRIEDTRQHFVLVLNEDGSYTQALMPLKGTQIKKSKQIMALISSVRIGGKVPPSWLNKIHLTTRPENNDKGSWEGVVPQQVGFVEDDDLYDAGKAFHDMVIGGKVKVEHVDDDESGGNGKF